MFLSRPSSLAMDEQQQQNIMYIMFDMVDTAFS